MRATPALDYATADAHEPRSTRGPWRALATTSAVPAAFVGCVHAIYVGQWIRLGRWPTTADDGGWLDLLDYLSVAVFFVSALCVPLQPPIAVWTAVAEARLGRRGRAAAAAAFLLVWPLVILCAWRDPFGAFDYWFD